MSPLSLSFTATNAAYPDTNTPLCSSNTLLHNRALFLKLAEVGDPESAPLWGGMRDELDTALRLCDHEIRKRGGNVSAAALRADSAELARLGSDSGGGATWGSFSAAGDGGAGGAGGAGLLQVRRVEKWQESACCFGC